MWARPLVTLAAIASLGQAVAAPKVPWLTDYQVARRLAAKTGRPMLIDVYGKGCSACVQLDRDTYSNPQVIRLLADAIPVRLDAGIKTNAPVCDAYGVGTLPTILVVDAKGRMRTSFIGFKPPKAFVAAIRPYVKRG